jgi:hypothetical protein
VREKGKPRDGIGALLQAAQPTLKTEISAPHSIYRLYRRRFSLFFAAFFTFLAVFRTCFVFLAIKCGPPMAPWQRGPLDA